ncbi:MAG: hypothetical protein IKQ83_02035 [Lachnospiraceae bacterium]|nr:hypothetical protein [Lachnospiraceae bacterium]
MNAKGLGFVIGLIIGLILVVILFRFANTDKKLKTEYDERQEKVRGKAYKYAFYTALAVQALLCTASICQIEIPIEDYILHFMGILFGCLVLGAYCIWNGVYWGLNNDHKRYGVVFAVCIVLNLIAVVGPVMAGMLFEKDGKIGMPALNFLIIFMMAVFGIEFLIKGAIDKKTDADDMEEE